MTLNNKEIDKYVYKIIANSEFFSKNKKKYLFRYKSKVLDKVMYIIKRFRFKTNE